MCAGRSLKVAPSSSAIRNFVDDSHGSGEVDSFQHQLDSPLLGSRESNTGSNSSRAGRGRFGASDCRRPCAQHCVATFKLIRSARAARRGEAGKRRTPSAVYLQYTALPELRMARPEPALADKLAGPLERIRQRTAFRLLAEELLGPFVRARVKTDPESALLAASRV